MRPSASGNTKACPGTCRGGSCALPRTYILAGCEGMVGLFERCADGKILLLPQADGVLFSSVSALHDTLLQAERSFTLGQLVLVGSAGDIGWIHRCLPDAVARHISAEVEYPFVSGWFRDPPEFKALVRALQQLIHPY